jgi:hypothetical protein
MPLKASPPGQENSVLYHFRSTFRLIFLTIYNNRLTAICLKRAVQDLKKYQTLLSSDTTVGKITSFTKV